MGGGNNKEGVGRDDGGGSQITLAPMEIASLAAGMTTAEHLRAVINAPNTASAPRRFTQTRMA